ncbi:uncharacterized protein BX663DRAFT_478802 [Cokeromyces recurvatus]|uniref:uncharacterized protein n=1 Tax=Cokeromyces recurvatus TaxID=90255 RepID=UPI00222066AB|nr:uncharacterized protein BX663DRAFT_478802 [Cokeromyces recurvatus]KAI7899246.1 hypothetical protein BX663DRAFT_478802 [Cokeromyces recurvatus]
MTSVTVSNGLFSIRPYRHSNSNQSILSSSSTPSLLSPVNHTPKLTIKLDQEDNASIRPNSIIRGSVILKTIKTIHASQIRIKFRGVECASAKVKETSLDKMDRIETIKTLYFEIDTLVWGNEPNAFAVDGWQSIEPGEHEYQFALKFPNVNFPPSTEDPAGFSIRYIWTAFLDGPAHHPGLQSPDLVTTFRPLLVAPINTPWTFNDTLFSKKITPLATLKVQLPAQVFCPDQSFTASIQIHTIPTDTTIGSFGYKLRKCYEGKVPLSSSNTSIRSIRKQDIFQSMIPLHHNDSHIEQDVTIDLPSRLLSPSFTSHYIRVYYYLVLMIQFDIGKGIKKTSHHMQTEVPIGIANLNHGYLVRVPELTSIQHYQLSLEAPYFFDPSLETPPLLSSSSSPSSLEWFEPSENDTLPPPPAYFSLTPQFIRKERQEKTRYASFLVKPNMFPELGEPYLIKSDDHEW